ncbi:acyl-CoA thioesterase [Allokutzneria sp. A3M-2-11 16]|uniref:acyl-CoA thioesterase n=1 Tax=Allokutzneria sp. A3M-2-11 16 TaxID=2962043 RepID=UPI0020B759F4|nr:acyl-CoA thioesterase [Allokutzneria sp. A3M-2-11 16]MCP3802872.1 acyl-CoA thioesterase [Allokutzneria sp. A3M-2-11 16]
MTEPYSTRIAVRGYELDTQGHLHGAIYQDYGEHVRWEMLRAAGASQEKMLASRIGPVMLEINIRYLAELGAGDEVDVTCAYSWGAGKTFRIEQRFTRADGVLAAEMRVVGGVLDLETRKLVANPAERIAEIADDPSVLGL